MHGRILILRALALLAMTGACSGTPASTTTPATHPADTASTTDTPATPPLPDLRLPDNVRPTRYALTLDIDPESEFFAGAVTIDVEFDQATSFVWLNGTGLTIERAFAQAGQGPGQMAIAAHPVAGDEHFFGLALSRAIGPGKASLVIEYRGGIDSLRSQGIYRVKEPDGEWYVYTFFEPVDARRAVPSFDQPEFKVPWQLTISTPEGNVAAANTPEVSRSSEKGPQGQRTTFVFADTPPMPSYLLAFVVGPFEVIDGGAVGQKKVPLRFIIPQGRAAELGYAKEVTPRVVDVLEDFFAMPYPYKKLDVAVVPRFWGTMEHAGIVAMGQPLTLIKPDEDTILRRRRYANILVHELAHYWFGNYVTMAWWDDTWLNEALGTWVDQTLTARLEPSWRWNMEALSMTARAMSADSLTSAKQIRQPVKERTDITSSFDGAITYGKGAAMLRMFEHWVGPEVFRRAMHAYLARHAWGSAKTEDLLAVLGQEIRPELATAMATFLDQPGVPLVSVKLTCSRGKAPSLTLYQERFLPVGSTGRADQVWHIPVCVRYAAGKRTGEVCTLMKEAHATMALATGDIRGCPDWVMVNKGATGYYRVAYEKPMRDKLLKAQGALAPAELVTLVRDVEALVDSGKLDVAEALALAAPLIDSADRFVVREAMNILSRIRSSELPDELRPNHGRMVDALFGARAAKMGWKEAKGESLDVTLLRSTFVSAVAYHGHSPALVAEAGRLARAWIKDRKGVAPDLVSAVLRVAAYHGDRALFDELLRAIRATTNRRERTQLLDALGGFRDPALSAEALALIIGDEFDIRDLNGLLFGALGKRETREQTYAFIKEHYDSIFSRLRDDEKSWAMAIPGVFCDAEHRKDAAEFFGPRAERIDGGPRALAKSLERIDLCIAATERDAAGIARFLARY